MRAKLHGEITEPYFSDMPVGTRGTVEHDHQEYWRFTYLEPAPKAFGNVRSLPRPVTKTIHSIHFKLVKAA